MESLPMTARHTFASLKRSAAPAVEETAGANETWGVPQQNLGEVMGYPT